ncbi:type I-C CRISPR-associated protein Cas7/Csd2 [Enterococcus nangangensis]|uniref:type I-C CRISPR-associated protein Cas7/Csd2 n=1 Tax=Enterococcus nangangensis TaxID=2559926 RepID=UPI0010F65730|nr:type I-C CRISPR-associated protein Cas7/Csd2 [Enterococcus nangangensis]
MDKDGAIKNRYEFIVLFDVENGNPNGDPDADNMPRMDNSTNHGLVTDVCLKHKIRQYIQMLKEDEPEYDIYIKRNVTLNSSDFRAYEALGLDTSDRRDDAMKKIIKQAKKEKNIDEFVRDFMCKNFYDVRTFGAVMTTFTKNALNSGQVRGPVQIGFARSIDSIIPQEITLTRTAITTEKDAEDKLNTIGRKYIVPYALYRAEGYISANLARKVTGFSEEDLTLLWDAIANMFEHDRSASRGKMIVRELIIFKHDSELGNAPAHKLFEKVTVARKADVDFPSSYQDYEVRVDDKMPAGVTCFKYLD